VMVISGRALADEKVGNLVFNAMKKLQETHQTFLGDAKEIKAARRAAVTNRNLQREEFKKAKPGTLDKREAHARFSLSQAQVYRALYDEAKLTHQVAGKQLRILNKLNASVISGEARINAKGTMAVVKSTKPFLENARSLLTSLAESRHKIKDPMINSKLTQAAKTAEMLARFTKQIESGKINKFASQQLLRQKLAGLIEQLNALYVQTDIFMAMIRDKSTVLKMINQVAAAESAIWALSDGKKIVAHLSSDIMEPLMDLFSESDEDLEMLTDGVLEGQDSETPGASQGWVKVRL